MKKRVAAIYRAARFSPNSVQKDAAILENVTRRLDADVTMFSEDAWPVEGVADGCYDYLLSMARSPEVLDALDLAERQGAKVINRAEGVRRCCRSVLNRIMRQEGIPVPPERGEHGCWLKRGDAAAQEEGDVCFVADERELAEKITAFRERGISNYVVSAHLEGDLVKFYGVKGAGFFRYYYPTDDGDSKFGDERRNGVAHHYAFSLQDLHQTSERLAEVVGIDVYGGDCIVTSEGRFFVIDYNDWPSFSRCREEAAEAIASLVK